ncbi:MAG: hypothetical protein A3C46_07045 [Deltaproteobacteria bacterium RIFCSPHIGHO2_02_FULL_44_16]|nr:MAG: hypothetical protein A3C46_07045 [Deltaproteobacteria bacterium RIFCSPHIGHO2_02_FULL_44_16]
MEREKLHILVVCSDDEKQSLWQRHLKNESPLHYHFSFAAHIEEALQTLLVQPVDVIVSVPLTQPETFPFIKMVKNTYPFLPLLILSPWDEMRFGIEAMQCGADDIISLKTFTSAQFIELLRQHVEKQRIRQDLKQVVNRAFLHSTQDPLTGLANRALLQERLNAAISSTKRHGGLLGILYLDLDNFKTVNDDVGHATGDELLTQLGKRFLDTLRKEDVIARVGGDEFVAIVSHLTSLADLDRVAHRLLSVFQHPIVINERSFAMSASIGASIFPFDGEHQEELLQKADTAMYLAKKSGGNCYQYFNKQIKEVDMAEQKESSSHKTILIIEDDRDCQRMLEKRLTSAGYHCVQASSVEEALTQLSSVHPSLVILDLGFQKASGIAFLQSMTNHLKQSDTVPPVLVISGHATPDIQEFVNNLGASGFIEKPFKSEEVLSKIDALIH